MMIPIADCPITPGESRDIAGVESDQVDPVRRLVHVALALYLTPVILVVCLIGGVSIVVEKAARTAERLAFGPHHRGKGRQIVAARSGIEKAGPRFRGDREGTRTGL